jgi:hypothetical protein
MPAEAALSKADTSRLVECIRTVADRSNPNRWVALDQLRYFCDGADTELLEVIGGQRFSSLSVLVGLLQEVDDLGGHSALAGTSELARVPVGFVLQLLEALLCSAPNNLEAFLKVDHGVRLLVRFLNSVDEFANSQVHQRTQPATQRRRCVHGRPGLSMWVKCAPPSSTPHPQPALAHQATDPSGLVLVDRACNVLCYLTYHHRDAVAPFVSADGVASVTRVLQARSPPACAAVALFRSWAQRPQHPTSPTLAATMLA